MSKNYSTEISNLVGSLTSRLGAKLAAGTGLIVLSFSPSSSTAWAQDACCYQPAYRLQCETVTEPQIQTGYRQVTRTVPETREVTETRLVLRTRTEEREYTVAKPVTETSERVEEYTVSRPVLETSYETRERTTTRMVTETSEREEQYTSYRPVVETRLQQRQYQVQRPVTETAYQTQAYTSYRPVTSYQSQVVDAGGYVPQQVVTPGTVGYGLQWVPRAYQTTGPFGVFAVNRGGLFWTPQATPPTVQTQMAYRPNLITQQIAQTQYVPETVQQQVPVQRTRMETETVTENVPVQVQRMEAVTESRRVPVTVQRPVTETVSEQVPVQRYRYVRETKTRRVPVVSHRVEYETRKVPTEVQYYEPETITREVTVQRQVTEWEPYQRTVMVSRPVMQATAPSYYDSFGASIAGGYSSAMPVISSSTLGESVLQKPTLADEDADQKPKTVLEEVKNSTSEESPSDDPDAEGTGGASDSDDLDQPKITPPETGNETSNET